MLIPRLWIDGSSLAFIHGNKPDYQQTIYNHLFNLTEKFQTDEFNIILESSKTNFRNDVAVSNEYKGTRRTEKKIKTIEEYLPNLKDCFEEIKNTYSPTTYLNIENDDAIAILHTRIPNSVMIANDRDYLAIPGIYYNIKTNQTTVIKYPGTIELINGKIHATGYFQVYSQLLKGSQKENYKGVEGLGDKGVYKVLKDLKTEDELKQVCTQLFIDRYGIEEGVIKLEEGFRLCWIITHNESLQTPKPIKFSEIKLK
jgi:hypothetical protein